MKPSTHPFERLAASLSDILPPDLGSDVRANIRGALRGAFDRMDLVTREEFEVQEAVLRRSREKLAQLEQRVRELEELLEKRR
jgi:BMFP domain-containing protein YqiC